MELNHGTLMMFEDSTEVVSLIQRDKGANPIVAFQRVWRIVERVAMTVSALLVAGTVGYLSLHALT